MKKSILFVAFTAMMFFGGCAKPYVDVKSKDYAKLQLIPQSETLLFSDTLFVKINDYSKGCGDMVELGYLSTDSDTPSKIVKISVDKPLLIKAQYVPSVSGATVVYNTTDFVLTPEKNKHYVLEFVRKEVKGKMTTAWYVYMKDGKKIVDVPEKRIRDFNYRECM